MARADTTRKQRAHHAVRMVVQEVGKKGGATKVAYKAVQNMMPMQEVQELVPQVVQEVAREVRFSAGHRPSGNPPTDRHAVFGHDHLPSLQSHNHEVGRGHVTRARHSPGLQEFW